MLRFALYDGPMTFARSDHEARVLITEIERQLGEGDAVAVAGQR